MFKDPICGMEVSESEATFKYEYKGKTYYFCSLYCKEEFEKEPERYIQKREEDTSNEES
jgi:YHS domain-containing protein